MFVDPKILTSPYPKLEEGLTVGKTLWEYIDARIDQVVSCNGDKTTLIDGSTDESFSYLEFRKLVKRTAWILRHRYGVDRGSVVIVCSRNNLYFPVALYAGVALGATAFSIPSYSHDRIPVCLGEEAEVPVIFCDDSNLPFIRKYVDCASRRPALYLVEGQDAVVPNIRTLLSDEDIEADACDNIKFDFTGVDIDDHAVVFFSSGSTGPPKPVCHSHRNLLSLSYNTYRTHTDEEANQIKMFSVDQAHMAGFIFFFENISFGSTLIVCSNFNVERFLPVIDRYRVTQVGLYVKDAVYLSKVDDWRKYDLSCVKEIIAYASMFPTSIVTHLKEMFPGLESPVQMLYGSTELLCAIVTAGCGVGEVEAGIGHVLPLCKAKIVDLKTREILGPRELGEIWFHSPFRFVAYRNRPDLDAELISPDGWYKTGDYGFYDEHNRLHMLDRVKDLIHLGSGEIVSPSAIENLILEHPGVSQVGVVGVPPADGGCGEVPRAFVIKKPVADLSPEEIVDFVQERTDSKSLHLTGGAELINSMLTSPGGKVYRFKLRADFLKAREAFGLLS